LIFQGLFALEREECIVSQNHNKGRALHIVPASNAAFELSCAYPAFHGVHDASLYPEYCFGVFLVHNLIHFCLQGHDTSNG